jgi:hypothetical protein
MLEEVPFVFGACAEEPQDIFTGSRLGCDGFLEAVGAKIAMGDLLGGLNVFVVCRARGSESFDDLFDALPACVELLAEGAVPFFGATSVVILLFWCWRSGWRGGLLPGSPATESSIISYI